MSDPSAEQHPSGEQDTGVAVLCHLAALSIYVGIPFGNILGPLVVWLLGRSRSAFVDDQGKEALNFQISFVIYAVVVAILAAVLGLLALLGFARIFIDGWIALGGLGLLILAAVALAVVHLILTVVAAVQASGGTRYRYPLTVRLIR